MPFQQFLRQRDKVSRWSGSFQDYSRGKENFMRLNSSLLFAALLLAAAGTLSAEEAPRTKKFLTKPLVIEDQGSFFIGGVPKVTTYATVPGPNQTPAPAQITI